VNKGFLNIRNGVFCIIAMASSTFAAGPIMYFNDLNNFVIDCDNKKQQVELLQSMRRDTNNLLKDFFTGNWTTPGPVATKRSNWLVDQLLTEIKHTCYDNEKFSSISVTL